MKIRIAAAVTVALLALSGSTALAQVAVPGAAAPGEGRGAPIPVPVGPPNPAPAEPPPAVRLRSDDGRIVMRGATYEARFTRDGIRVRAEGLGERAALRYALDEIRSGDAVLFSRATAGLQEPAIADSVTVQYNRAQGITEKFEGRAAGVEQLIVIEGPPVAPGGAATPPPLQ